MAEYEHHIQFLQRSYASKKWSVSSMITLMEQTADMRREWVQRDEPSVSQLLEKFPCLADPRIVRFHQYLWEYFHNYVSLQMLNEFCQITGAIQHDFENMWEEYERLILKYAPLEDKRAVKKLIAEYNALESECAGKCVI